MENVTFMDVIVIFVQLTGIVTLLAIIAWRLGKVIELLEKLLEK